MSNLQFDRSIQVMIEGGLAGRSEEAVLRFTRAREREWLHILKSNAEHQLIRQLWWDVCAAARLPFLIVIQRRRYCYVVMDLATSRQHLNDEGFKQLRTLHEEYRQDPHETKRPHFSAFDMVPIDWAEHLANTLRNLVGRYAVADKEPAADEPAK
jgi:hypothetical protein